MNPRLLWPLSLGLLVAATAAGEGTPIAVDRVRPNLARLPISFVANSGQTDSAVAYSAQTFAGTVFVTRSGRIVYSLPPPRDPASQSSEKYSTRKESRARAGWSLTEVPVGDCAFPAAGRLSAAQVNSFIGDDPQRWRRALATYESVSLGEVWPGISLELEASGSNIEKIFTVKPGADPSKIRMSIRGARSLRIDRSGALTLATGFGEVTFTPPAAFQEKDGARRPVEVSYALRGSGYGFRLAGYDRALPVRIDPLVQATYLGGGGDNASALAIRATSGDVYVAGYTYSPNFPGTAGGAQPTRNGGEFTSKAFVARLNPALTELLQATYLGGAGDDFAFALAIASSGDVYVAGQTNSQNFPGTRDGAQPAPGNGPFFGDAFVARLNASLTTLVQSTYLGGSTDETANALAVHPESGDVYVAGGTSSTDFPGTAGGAQPASGAQVGADAFVARLNTALTANVQSTYLGGRGVDIAYGLAIHPTSGDVYVAGLTTSADFPGAASGAQPIHRGSGDAFVVRLNPSLATGALTRATYLGGSDSDHARAVAIHPASGDIYVAGYTQSPDFPGAAGGAQAASGGFVDAFAARLNPSLTTLVQATYLGGGAYDTANSLAIHPVSGDVYVAGQTGSSNFPGTVGGAQRDHGGGLLFVDAYVARLNSGLTTLRQGTYLGGSQDDVANALAIHPTSGDVYAAGQTVSADLPGATGGAQARYVVDGGPGDAFLARLTPDLAIGCSADATTLCLNGGRFKVQVRWTTPQDQTGPGQAVTLTSDTGYFWFFSASNVEIVVKVLDGRAFNARFWVFAGGLTNVAVVLTVTDTFTGAIRTYANPQGVAFQPIQDTSAFAGAGAAGATVSPSVARSTPIVNSVRGPCVADPTTLCLNGGRFQVRTQWTTREGQSGAGRAVDLTGDTGYFWFFSPSNVEMVVKAVTGCSFNSHYWVFAGGLTDVHVVTTVTDTRTGAVLTDTNPQGTAFQPIQNAAAFLCP